MEDTLRGLVNEFIPMSDLVLILVLMEDTLRVSYSIGIMKSQ